MALQKYLEFYDRIYNLREGEAQGLAEDLIKFCTAVKWDVCAVLILISNAAECKLMLLPEYWELFKIFFNHFNIKPHLYHLKSHIGILYSKEYKLKVNYRLFDNFPDHLKNYDNMTIEDLLNVYEPNTVMHHILHDNIEGFLECVDIFDEHSYKGVFENRSLIDWCCFYGSVKIFRFLRNLNVEITKECISSSFIGTNTEIIKECSTNSDIYIHQNDKLLQINNLEILLELHSEYMQNLSNLEKTCRSMNIKEFLIVTSLSNKPNEIFNNCAFFGIPEMVEYLFKYVDVDAKHKVIGRTALMWATNCNFIETLSTLIKLGANANENDGYRNALFFAVYFAHEKIFDLLLENGADVNFKENGDVSLLMWASRDGHVNFIRKLVKLGLKIDDTDSFGQTPLIYAAINNRSEAISVLVDLGAKIEAKTREGCTALMAAAMNNSTDCVVLLMELGADYNAKNKHGQTALSLAEDRHHTETIDALELQIALRLSMETFEE